MSKSDEKKQRARRGWCIALGILLVIAGVANICGAIDGYTPGEVNYYGNGTEWSATDSFYKYYNAMPTLRLAEGQTSLRIMQITDPQIKFGSWTQDTKTFDLLTKAFAVGKPDVVVVTGDLTLSIFARSAVKYFCDFMEKQQVYWCYVFGNHDSEFGLSKYNHGRMFADYKYCLFDGGPSNIKGESNYFVKVVGADNRLQYVLSLVDSNMYPDTRKGIEMFYDEVTTGQAEWYAWNIQGLQTIRADVQSSMFMHMPLRAYVDMYNGVNDGTITDYCGFVAEKGWTLTNPDGTTTEMPGIYCQTGNQGDGGKGGGYDIYDKIVALGSTKAVFCGHDHINTLRGIDKNGVMLAYGRSCGYHTYPFLDKKGDLPLISGLLESVFDYTEAQLYLSEWKDPDTGKALQKGVSFIDVDLSATNYGAIEMFDVEHGDLSDGKLNKQYVLTNK